MNETLTTLTSSALLRKHEDGEIRPVDAQESPQAPQPPKNRIPDIPVSQVRHVQSQEELDEVLAAHQMWVEQVLDPDVEVAKGRANLRGVDLRGFSLKGVNLSGANLSNANLAEVDLTSANLSAANLVGAILACANLSGVKLRGAKMEGADLRGADMTGAYLQGVDLSRSLFKSPDAPTNRESSVEDAPSHDLHAAAEQATPAFCLETQEGPEGLTDGL